jgi:hypothetical protein
MTRNIGYAFLCAIALPLWPGVALAKEPANLQSLLKGDYRVTTQESCIQTPSGFSGPPYWFPCSDFDPETGPGPECVLPSEYEVAVTGVYSFDGKGNARSTFKSLVIVDSPYHYHEGVGVPPPLPNFFLSGSEGECHYTYHVKPDRTFTLALDHCTGTQKVGFETGLPLYVAGGAPAEGFIAQGGQTLVTTTVEPAEQTIIVGDQEATRVCTFATHYYRVSASRNKDESNGKQPSKHKNLDPRTWW